MTARRSVFEGGRLAVGGMTFVPTGRPKWIGAPRARPKEGVGLITELGKARAITLFVGQKKGLKAKNQDGRCATKPGAFSPAAVDRAFFRFRAQVVGPHAVSGRRIAGRGWYGGQGEESVAYEIAFIPNADEPTYADFQKNMNRVAQLLAAEFCQDAVLILRDNGKKRTIADATWTAKHERALKRK